MQRQLVLSCGLNGPSVVLRRVCQFSKSRGLLLLLQTSCSGDARYFHHLKMIDLSDKDSEHMKGNSMVEHWIEGSLSVNFGG